MEDHIAAENVEYALFLAFILFFTIGSYIGWIWERWDKEFGRELCFSFSVMATIAGVVLETLIITKMLVETFGQLLTIVLFLGASGQITILIAVHFFLWIKWTCPHTKPV